MGVARFYATTLALVVGCGLQGSGAEAPPSSEAGSDVEVFDGTSHDVIPIPDVTSDLAVFDRSAPDGSPVDASADAPGPVDAPVDCGDASDPANCGACGHDCLGGACVMGACQPVTLASQQISPRSVVVVGANVYWTDIGAGVSGCTLPNCAPTFLCASSDADDLVATTTSIYWSSYAGNQMLMSTVAGCGAPPRIIESGGGQSGVAIDAAAVYWVDFSAGTVMKAALDGTGVTMLASGQQGPRGLEVDATFVYWVNGTDGSVWRANKGTGTGATELYNGSSVDNPDRIAVDAAHVFWAEEGGRVMRAGLDGSSPTTMANGLADPRGVATDGVHVYWTSMSGGTVMRCPVAGCGGAPATIASGQPMPDGITLDAVSIYWANEGGSVMRLAK